jgi:hypothetical protein
VDLGFAQKVATDLQAYIDAGATAVGILDVMFDTLAPEEALASVQPSIEVCPLLKEANR